MFVSQQIPQQKVQEISLLVSDGKKLYSIKDGDVLYSFLYNNQLPQPISVNNTNEEIINLYKKFKGEVLATERIKKCFWLITGTSISSSPLFRAGEYLGVLYMKYTPDLTPLTREIVCRVMTKWELFYSSLIIFRAAGYVLYIILHPSFKR